MAIFNAITGKLNRMDKGKIVRFSVRREVIRESGNIGMKYQYYVFDTVRGVRIEDSYTYSCYACTEHANRLAGLCGFLDLERRNFTYREKYVDNSRPLSARAIELIKQFADITTVEK